MISQNLLELYLNNLLMIKNAMNLFVSVMFLIKRLIPSTQVVQVLFIQIRCLPIRTTHLLLRTERPLTMSLHHNLLTCFNPKFLQLQSKFTISIFKQLPSFLLIYLVSASFYQVQLRNVHRNRLPTLCAHIVNRNSLHY